MALKKSAVLVVDPNPKTGYMIGTGTKGKPRACISPEEVYELAKLHCTLDEMAKWFKIPLQTLQINFADEIAQGREYGKQRLRRKQFEVAMEGNPTMLIWLGKNMLGQSDQPVNNDDTIEEMEFEVIPKRNK